MGSRRNNGEDTKPPRRITAILDWIGITGETRQTITVGTRQLIQTLRGILRARHIRFLSLSFLVFFIITCWLLPSRWFYLVLGFIALAAGPVLNELVTRRKTSKGSLGVVLISIMVALGGLFSTLGWNEWTNFSEDREMLVAMATEWIMMNTCIDASERRIRKSITDETAPALPMMAIPYPTESNYAVTHSSIVRSDPKLKNALTVYIMSVVQFNEAYEHLMRASYMPSRDRAYRRKLLNSFAKKNYPLDQLLAYHKDLGDYLREEYPTIMTAAERQVDKDYLDTIRAMRLSQPVAHVSDSQE
ncbi:MAG: hypothetical protein ACYTAS_14530 [Planctomycetota bacterium]|jgi:hypothetical protein